MSCQLDYDTAFLQQWICSYNQQQQKNVSSVETTNKMQPCNRIYYSTVR